MKNKIEILVLCLFCQFCLGQTLTRKTLHGQVVNDSIKVENGIVFNINAKTGVVINPQGQFSVLAKVNDTLVFSSLGFKTKKIIVTDKEIAFPYLRVKLEAFVAELMAVVVYAKKGGQPNLGDPQAIIDTKYIDDEKSSPRNITMPPNQTIDNGMDFVRIYKDVFKKLKKKYPEKTDFVSETSFTKVATESVSYTFFTNTLKLREDEVGLFLIYCENDPKSRKLLKPEDVFELIDFLVTKNEEFKRIVTFEK